jgi:hypothetical protein
MQLSSFSRTGMLALFALTTLFTSPAHAKDGRDFAGFYSLTNITEKGGQVELTVGFELFNYSGAELQQAVVTLQSSAPGPDALVNFAPIKLWPNGGDIFLSQRITVSRAQLDRWSNRVTPVVFIAPGGENGFAHRRPAQLSRRHMIPATRPAAAE